jgi:hypothetical protein
LEEEEELESPEKWQSQFWKPPLSVEIEDKVV